MAKKKKAKKSNKQSAQYVVTSKVKDAIRGKGYRTAGDAVETLNGLIDDVIKRAISRCKENGRQTVRPSDF